MVGSKGLDGDVGSKGGTAGEFEGEKGLGDRCWRSSMEDSGRRSWKVAKAKSSRSPEESWLLAEEAEAEAEAEERR